MSISRETLQKLADIDTPTICNVIELYDIRPRDEGFMNGDIMPHFPSLPPMVGFAATAAFRSSAPPAGGGAYAGLEAQIEAFASLPRPAVVVFQDLDNPVVGATFGEIMCSTYQAFGSVGLITSGGGRDIDQIEPLNIRSSPARRSARTPTATSCTWACRFTSAGWWSRRATCCTATATA